MSLIKVDYDIKIYKQIVSLDTTILYTHGSRYRAVEITDTSIQQKRHVKPKEINYGEFIGFSSSVYVVTHSS